MSLAPSAADRHAADRPMARTDAPGESPASPRWRRADLHCHSVASTEADEAVLNALECPECYSEPADVYALAKRRGMDFVTITDHDCVDGVLSLGPRPDVIVGEEVTCYFPEDRCKMHVLVWGLTRTHHAELQARAADVYAFAEYVERHRLAHAVAHPLYRQNDRLGRWHLERLMLMFKGFECLNGAHSAVHRDALDPALDALTPDRIDELSARHGMAARWPRPWEKARTGGSDDHGLLNVGRTWTEFSADVTTPAAALDALREGCCRPGGEAGSSLKLAHNFVAVGTRYHARNLSSAARGGPETLADRVLQTLVGDRPAPRRRDLVKAAVRRSVAAAGRGIARPFRRPEPPAGGTALLGQLAWASLRARHAERAPLLDAAKRGVAPLGEHEAAFRLIAAVDRDVAAGLFATVAAQLGSGRVGGLFDALGAAVAQQVALLPYYFALFHQNRERHLCGGVTGHGRPLDAGNVRVALFTDTFDQVNGVSRFLRRLGRSATERGRSLTVVTCDQKPVDAPAYRHNFAPVATAPLPGYREIAIAVPPVLEVLEWADRQQFDAIHVSTPGPVGLLGLLVAKMLRVPVLATYHTDFPAFVRELTGDHRLSAAAAAYMGWFYAGPATVFARSRAYQATLANLGVSPSVVKVLPPCTDADAFHPRHRDAKLYDRMGVRQPLRLLYVGRASAEKNLALLAAAFGQLCDERDDVALIVVGDGPMLPELKRLLAGRPAHFLGYRSGAELAALYASADLFVFPSRTDTLGQAVIEAQACGLPVLVSDVGGPREVMDDGVTGRVVAGTSAADWSAAVDDLLDDVAARARMSRTAPQRVGRFARGDGFEAFWDHHVTAAQAAVPADVWCAPDAATPSSLAANSASPSASANHAVKPDEVSQPVPEMA